MTRFKITLTWSDWWPLLIHNNPSFPDYFSIGIGPIYIEAYWGRGGAPWEV